MGELQKAISSFKIEGLVCAPCTPFKDNGDVNLDVTEAYIKHILDFNIQNAFITGTLGEGLAMTTAERKQVMDSWVKHGKGKLRSIIAHIGGGNLRESQELAAYAQEIGIDAISCIGPSFFKPATLDDYVEYMAQVAAAAPKLPFYLYDFEQMNGINFDTNQFFHLAADRIPTLRGAKHTTPNLVSMHNIIMDHGDRFQILMGSDELFLEGLSIGLESTIINSYSGICLSRCKEAFDKGDMKEARKQQAHIVKFCQLRTKHGLVGPAAGKGPLKGLFGLDFGSPRPPLKPLDASKVDAFTKDITDIGYFEWGIK